ncbi:hypothetical protein E7744_15615 (plasmid) [Citricoccus sp. SGAir0253]|uniref:hypothetical protein n=1 Tax=Citricoccus sp. SGAir0253 TaxID=2567881 RepID=UPI0010CD03BD|nr:hypothetical protein [Citricoccus sp. SGAir0253]QCU79733.1 hypothetical protein E7744_15615 [Citricoccus sp. SGAir0253]
MAEENDGIDEVFEGQLRVAITAAGQIGERMARALEESQRRAQATSEQEARELASRLAAERQAARTELGAVHRKEWWDNATPEQIGRSYQVACAWAAEDPEAVRAEHRIRDEVRTRYGIDVDNTGADPEAVGQAVQVELERAERDRADAATEQGRAQQENTEAQLLMAQADHEDRRADQARAAEYEPDPDERIRAAAVSEQSEAHAVQASADGATMYDSSERREGTARELEARGIDSEVVATRLRADVSQGRPATEAVTATGKTTAPKVRKAAGRGPTVQRSGLDR